MRLFVAVALPPDLAGRLVALQDSLKAAGARVSWVRGENIHITLKFLGEVEEKRIPKMIRVLQEAVVEIPAFTLNVEGLGCFPPAGAPRVIWVGVGKGASELSHLHVRVEESLARIGFPREGKRFTGHLTLGRVRSPEAGEALRTRIASLLARDLGEVPVREVFLMQSELHPTGSRYTVVSSFPLQGGEVPLSGRPTGDPVAWDPPSLRRAALQIFRAAIAAVEGAAAVRRHVTRVGSLLHVDGITVDLSSFRRVFVVGGGKAVGSMAAHVEEILGDHLTAGCVVVKYGHGFSTSRVRVVEAGHPVPDAAGLHAAEEILRMAAEATPRDLLLVLLSGGGSALLPLPAPGIGLQEKQDVTALLLGCGATIHEINTVRSHLSRIKGGQLAAAAAGARTLSLLLSDVVDDSLHTIASGPTAPDPTTFAEAEAVLKRYDLAEKVPASVRHHLRAGVWGERPETPKAGDPLFASVTNLIVGSLREALTAAAEAARGLGLTPQILTHTLQGEAQKVAPLYGVLARKVRLSRDPVPPPACLLTGGETTVTLQGSAGRGGRNMELAAAAAVALQDLPQVLLLSAGTDGTDGPTDAAGALADGTTAARAQAAGLDLERALREHDTYPLFQALGDLVVTGPTGTNVMDMQILLVGEAG